jgi:hypothetical protein
VSRASDGPRSIGDSLRQLASRYKKVDLLIIDDIRERWPDIVGDALATRCHPEIVRERVLFVRVPTGAVAQRLRMEESAIVTALSVLGERAPIAVQVVVGERVERGL